MTFQHRSKVLKMPDDQAATPAHNSYTAWAEQQQCPKPKMRLPINLVGCGGYQPCTRAFGKSTSTSAVIQSISSCSSILVQPVVRWPNPRGTSSRRVRSIVFSEAEASKPKNELPNMALQKK